MIPRLSSDVPLAVRVLLAFAIYTHVGEQVLTAV